MQKFSIGVLSVLVALVGMAQADSVPPPSQITEGPSGLSVGQIATVQGLVRFEEHHTIIPMNLCAPRAPIPCVRSRLYWSVVLTSDTSQFEIDQRFALDQTTAPASIELAGQVIRPGQVVKVDATVEYAGTDYYILGDVRNVNLVLDYSTVSLPNWSCHGTVDRNTEIQAQVWYDGGSASEGAHYALHLSGAENSLENHRSFSLASLDDAQGFSSRDQLVYQGQSADASVELVIARSADTSGELPDAALEIGTAQLQGRLKFTLAQVPSEHSRIQTQGDFPVVCARTR